MKNTTMTRQQEAIAASGGQAAYSGTGTFLEGQERPGIAEEEKAWTG